MTRFLSAIGSAFQGTALFLVVFGSAICLVGCWRNWPEAKTLGGTIAGAGVQAITTAVRNTLKAEDGSTVNLGSSQPSTPTQA